MSLATHFDLSREELIQRFRQRTEQGHRTKLSKDELGQLALHFVDRLKQLDTEAEIQALAQAELALLEEGYPQSSIGSLYLPVYRRLIQEAINDGTLPLTEATSHRVRWTKRNTGETGETQEHYGLTYLKYDQATYTKLRQATTAANNERQDNLQAVPLERYLEQATELLGSNQPELLAIAIAAVTGRRHTEVVAKGTFTQTRYPYLLRFEGQQKDPTPPFDILTLLPASEVLAGIERFRSLPEVRRLAGLGHDHPKIDAFNARVNRRVNKLFGQIVPVLEGFKRVTIHRLRGVYGAIAVHFFCPQMKHEHRFLQHYLGHLLEESGQDLPNAAATQHYFHYRLVNPQGQILQARGVKVMANGLPPQPDGTEEAGVQLESDARTRASSPDSTRREAAAANAPRQRGSLRIYRDERDQWLRLLQQVGPECLTQQDRMSVLLRWAHARFNQGKLKGKDSDESGNQQSGKLGELEDKSVSKDETGELEEVQSLEAQRTSEQMATQQEAGPETNLTPVVVDQAKTLAWLTERVTGLEAELAALKLERDSLKTQTEEARHHQPEVEVLRGEKAQLAQALAQAEAKLEGFRRLLNGNGTVAVVPPTPVGRSGPPSAPVMPGVVGRSSSDSDGADTPVSHSAVTPPMSLAVERPLAKRRKGGGAKDRAKGIFAAIQQWNHQHPENTFAINSGLLEQTFGINRKAAKEFVAEFQNLIWEHHQAVGVENERSHNRGKEMEELKRFVQNQR